MKSYKYFIGAALIAAAAFAAGCSDKVEGGDDNGNESGEPTARSITEIQFVSRLTDGTLITSDSDFNAINDYMVGTLKGREKSSLTILDRMDGVSVSKMMELSVNTYRWNVYALNSVFSVSSSEGSAVYFNEPTANFSSYKSGVGAFVSGLSVKMAGAFQKLDAEGNIVSSNDVSSDVNFYTVRLSTEEQIAGFGGASGAMNAVKSKYKNMVVVGTVKNGLFETLKSAVTSADSAYKATEIVKGSGYTIFMVSADKYWNYYDATKTELSNGIAAYAVHIGWK